MTRSLLAALALGALCTVLIAAVLLDVGNSSAELLSGEDALASRLVQYQAAPLRRTVRESGSQLADLVDSPLMLAKQKIDQYLDEDNTDLAGSTAKMHVVGSGKGGAPCTSLRCNHGAYQNDYLEEAEDRLDQVTLPRSSSSACLPTNMQLVRVSPCGELVRLLADPSPHRSLP
jgi:hypothetical protein